jgi:hypothetical protein
MTKELPFRPPLNLLENIPDDADLLPVQLNGKNYDFKYEPRCRVCTAGDNTVATVNRLLTQGYTYTQVINSIREANETLPNKITYNSIRTHSQRHLPERSAAIRTIVEERSAQRAADFVEGVTNLITPQILAEAIVKKGFENVVYEGTVITPLEALTAAKVMNDFTKDEQGQMDVTQAFAQLNRIIAAVKAVCPPEMWQEIVVQIQAETPTSLTKTAVSSRPVSSPVPFDPPEPTDDRDDY